MHWKEEETSGSDEGKNDRQDISEVVDSLINYFTDILSITRW